MPVVSCRRVRGIWVFRILGVAVVSSPLHIRYVGAHAIPQVLYAGYIPFCGVYVVYMASCVDLCD
jgi:hypothetical protein